MARERERERVRREGEKDGKRSGIALRLLRATWRAVGKARGGTDAFWDYSSAVAARERERTRG